MAEYLLSFDLNSDGIEGTDTDDYERVYEYLDDNLHVWDTEVQLATVVQFRSPHTHSVVLANTVRWAKENLRSGSVDLLVVVIRPSLPISRIVKHIEL